MTYAGPLLGSLATNKVYRIRCYKYMLNKKTEQKLIVVLGMHRSGTSAITKGLETLGVRLSEEVIPSGEGNEKGHWEDLDIVCLNDRVLSLAGMRWDSPAVFPISSIDSDVGQSLVEEAVNLIQKRLNTYQVWAFKDPRTSRLLAFWLRVFDRIEVKPEFLVTVRNPLDVAKSLEKRDGFLFERCQHLWLQHTLANLGLLSEYNTCFVDFSCFLEKPGYELLRLSAKLELNANEALIKQFSDSYLDKSLCHSKLSIVNLSHVPNVSNVLIDSFRLMLALCDERMTLTALKENHLSLLELGYQNFQKGEINRLASVEQELVKADFTYQKVVLERQTLTHELNLASIQTEGLHESLSGKAEELKQIQIELESAQQGLIAAQASLHDANIQISMIYNSASWKASAPLRFLKRVSKSPLNLLRRIDAISHHNGGYLVTGKKAIRVLKREGVRGIFWRCKSVAFAGKSVTNGTQLQTVSAHAISYEDWVKQFGTVTQADEVRCLARLDSLTRRPKISILMPVFNAPEKYLREALESIIEQIYPNWELCLADDCSTEHYIRDVLEEYKAKDCRIKVVYRETNGHISEATNSALEIATGEFTALMDNDDILPKDALFWVVDEINKNPEAALVYSDEDKISEDGAVRFEPHFKSSWNPDLFLSQNFISHLGVYRTDIAKEIGGFNKGVEGAQDWDFALRFIEKIEARQISHIPRILYHWRAIPGSTAVNGGEKPYALLAGVEAVNQYLGRKGVKGKASVHPDLPYVKVKYELPEDKPLVSIIIPTRNGLDILSVCLDSIFGKTSFKNFEVLVVDNGSDDPATLDYLSEMEISHKNLRIIRDDSPFNYSALNNKAAKLAKGELIALVNNDIEVVSPGWLEEMVSHAIRPEVGAVGARLWYPDNTLQHGGVTLVCGVAGHSHKHLPKGNPGYFSRAMLTQNYTAVTAACLVIKKSIFEEVGGLNENDLKIAFNDVDFCLKVHSAGYRNVWTPFAELIHYESKTRGFEDTPEKQARFSKEIDYMQGKWQHLIDNDPYYNPNLNNQSEDFSIASNPRIPY